MNGVRIISALAVVVLLMTPVTAFPPPRMGGGAVCLLMDEKPSADPMVANSPAAIDIARACYITLFLLGPDGMPQPYLCSDFRLDWFDRDLSIILRGAGFSNGAKITAADCKFTIERVLRGRPDLRSGFTALMGVDEFISGDASEILGLTAVSSDELRFHLESAERALELVEALCNPAFGIISKERFESMGRNYFITPATSGPFDYTLGAEGIILTHQVNYPFGRPWLDSIILNTGSGESAHVDFSIGNVDLLEAPPAYYNQYKNDIHLFDRSAEAGVMLEYILLLDPEAPPLNEKTVRYAIRLAIDHHGLADVALGGAALNTYLVPADAKGLDYSDLVESAITSLANYGDLGLYPLELAYPDADGRAVLMAERIAMNLELLGIKVTPVPVSELGDPGRKINTGMLLMPAPLSTIAEPSPQSVIELARAWGFGSSGLMSAAAYGGTAKDCYLPILRPQRLVVTGDDFITPSFGLWGEIDFYRLSKG